MDVTIRAEQPHEAAAIEAVVTAAFGDTGEVARMVAGIRASDLYRPHLALVADHPSDGVVGFVMVSGATVRSADGDAPIAMLSPLGVAPTCQRAGIGGALVRAALTRADVDGDPFVVLEGSPAYYPRFGFEPAAPHGIRIHLPDWAPPEAAQVAFLTRHDPTATWWRGEVVYPPAVAALG
ncbi:MAG TPA: N-acetyltransferase [Ilumatobacter sp.]|nr:N-acetyltransferase [Ilumatobacter sp.]